MKILNSFLINFAGKNIWRHKGRSFFISLSVSLAVTICIWVMAFFDGMNYQIERAVINTNTGHYQLQENTYAFNTDSSSPLLWSQEIKDLIISTHPVSYSPELVLDANISTPEGSAGLIALGIIPKLHQSFLPIASHINEGSFLSEDDEDGIVIGQELASDFKFNIGDEFVINYQDINGELRSEILYIKGIYDFNAKIFQRRFVYITQKTWQNLFFNEYTSLKFNRISLIYPSFEEGTLAKEKLKPFTVKSWKDLNPEMGVVLDFHHGMVKLFFLIIVITIMMTILTPVRMLWQERLKEFKMLHTLGVSFKDFWAIGISEIILMIALASLLSILILGVVLGIQSYTGLDFSFINQGQTIERSGIALPRVIYPRLSFEQILITVVMVIGILSSSYIWSISRTLKKLKEGL